MKPTQEQDDEKGKPMTYWGGLAQPEQEPQGGYRWREGDVPPSITYTAPPQREWQGLTDEEIKEIVFVERSWADAVRKVEAKLKEKNAPDL